MPNIVAGKSPSSPARARHRRGIALQMRSRAPASSSATSVPASMAPAPMPARRRGGGRDQDVRRRSDRLDLVDQRTGQCGKNRRGGARRFRPCRYSRQQCRHFARPHLPPHELADWSDVITVHLHGSFAMSRLAHAFPRAEFGSLVHMTSTSGCRQFRPGQLHGAKMGIVGLSRGIALDMARFNVRSNCVAPFAWTRMIDSIPAETNRKKPVSPPSRMTPEKIAPLVVYLGSDRADGISGQIFSVRNKRDLSVQSDPPDPHAASLRRLDAGKARRPAQGRLCASFTPLDRSSDVFSWDPV